MKEQITVTTIELTEEELETMHGGWGDDCGWRDDSCDDDRRDWRDDCGDDWGGDDCDRVYIRRGCRW